MTKEGRGPVIVVGAGAGGMLAAARAAETGAKVLLLEKTDGPGKKIMISGKTRCNLTNARELDDFIAMYGPNGRFLYSAFRRFFREDLLDLLRRYGVETKSERGGRIFPASDDARDVVKALRQYMNDHGVQVRTRARVTAIVTGNPFGAEPGREGKSPLVPLLRKGETDESSLLRRGETNKKFLLQKGETDSSFPLRKRGIKGDLESGAALESPVLPSVTGVEVDGKLEPASAVILAAGGASYPHTGSSGDGYAMAVALGHTITKLRPALAPLVVEEVERAKSLQGVALRNIRLTSFACPSNRIDPSLTPATDWGRGAGRKRPPPPVIESRLGDMMFTHFGIGGPVTLLMSLAVVIALESGPVSVSIDLKPGLTRDQLRERLQRDFRLQARKGYRTILKGLLPQKMIDVFVQLTGIPAEKPGNQISAEERERLLDWLKSLRFNIKSPLPLSAAIVTSGGVSLDEIDPRTMASRLVRGLYFCGEVMDIDADTGGYNLQAAFSTGFVAGEEAAKASM